MKFIVERPCRNGAHSQSFRRAVQLGRLLFLFSLIVFLTWSTSILSSPLLAERPVPAFKPQKSTYEPERIPSEIRFNIGEDRYLARPVRGSLRKFKFANDSLATVISVQPGEVVDLSFVENKRKEYLDQDDVFRPEFLTGIIFHGIDRSAVKIPFRSSELPQTVWTHEHFPEGNESIPPLRPGPYMIISATPHEVHRIHRDPNRAFIQSVLLPADGDTSFSTVEALGDDDCTLRVPVLSRLCAQPSACLPLDGVRIAVKDVFHLQGLHTSLNSRAFHDLYPAQNDTASAVRLLTDSGAQVVGKTQMSAYILQEHPTQSVEYAAAFNPRGDGYQIPGGSSGGSAAAVASYDWLDAALGTDTTGSMRIPALMNGVFSLRTTNQSVPMHGAVSIYREFDTPGLFTRDLGLLRKIASVWLLAKKRYSPSRQPLEIILPTDLLPSTDPEQAAILESFVSDIAHHAHTEARRISIAERWAVSAPEGDADLHAYLHNATAHGFYYAAYHSFDAFRSSYEQRFKKHPFISEVVRWIWDAGAKVTHDEHAEMNRRFKVFQAWFISQFMHKPRKNVIFVIPIDHVAPNYRDEYPGLPSEPIHGLRNSYLSPIIGAPELAVPISQVAYQSRVSGNTEFLPVVVSLMGSPGADLQLIDTALELLKKAGRPTKVLTGKKAFDKAP